MTFTKLEPASYDKDGDLIDGYTVNQRVAGYLEQIAESLHQLVEQGKPIEVEWQDPQPRSIEDLGESMRRMAALTF